MLINVHVSTKLFICYLIVPVKELHLQSGHVYCCPVSSALLFTLETGEAAELCDIINGNIQKSIFLWERLMVCL